MINYAIDFTAKTLDGLSSKDFHFSIYGMSQNGNVYDPRIVTTSTVSTAMFAAKTTLGANSKTYGFMELENSDGVLDYMTSYIFENVAIIATFYTNDNVANSSISIVIDSIEFTMTRVILNLRDYLTELDKPILTEVYGGTNVLPDGVDGTSDIKGQIKPWALGINFNVEPVLVNTSRLIYQVSIKEGIITCVSDKGVVLTAPTNPAEFATIAEMQEGYVDPGSYKIYNGSEGLFFKLGSTPEGIVTCFVTGSPFNVYGTIPILTEELFNTALLSQTLSSVLPTYEAGVYLTDSSTYRTVISDLTGSVGAWYGSSDWTFSINGSVFNGPDTASVLTLDTTNIVDIERTRTNDSGNGIPIWRISFNHLKNDKVLSPTDFAGSLLGTNYDMPFGYYEWEDENFWDLSVTPQALQNILGREYSTYVVDDPDIKVLYPKAEEITINSLLRNPYDASVEANRLFALYNKKRVAYVVTVCVDQPAQILQQLKIGYVVKLQLDRFGLDNGEDFSIIGVETDYFSKIAKLTLWG